ncbi:DUF1810 domain-containing protein [Pelagovum pacificum]|uniref:DUF1810 domain-containing protein n=1 Tax=Pelagovum pacificum TaxID=2588711 RepID=A0A5C5GI67_9RHOB|nr:DUF1810 domain-containing protein [Pelagovum pacificum]QQA43028.1 DUF1810 domain-containing protein [Pelagovum pacificum]TNY33827.1 DUF1810 domain-containing protein [Pelagovum pacificum]
MPGLSRFLSAQQDTYETARAEIIAGRKRSHWMWFIYPQLRGLGRSETGRFYGIEDRDEAVDYFAHPMLGPRLVEMATVILPHEGTPAATIFGQVDALKLRSSMTLFDALPGTPEVFGEVLEAFYDGDRCDRTLAML